MLFSVFCYLCLTHHTSQAKRREEEAAAKKAYLEAQAAEAKLEADRVEARRAEAAQEAKLKVCNTVIPKSRAKCKQTLRQKARP